VGVIREERPLVRLLEAIEAEHIGYIAIGMAAANAQGVMANTLDVDLWIALPPRQYMRLLNLSRRLGATIGMNANGVPSLSPGLERSDYSGFAT
jgi:hypothetical protein